MDTTTQAKPTPGPWTTGQKSRYRNDIDIFAGERRVASAAHNWDTDTQKANARLIAEAGTVHHETGLTPRQLAEQRAELREALEGILAITDRDHVAWDRARAALANSRT